MFEAHEKGLKDAWTVNRPVAHLAAALLQHIVDHKLRRFRGSERRRWRHEIVPYLEHAAFFEQFLVGLKSQSSLLRFSVDDLIKIPGHLAIKATAPGAAFELPREARAKSLTG
jgi:hypothetical protein